jgi:hypothetical protein
VTFTQTPFRVDFGVEGWYDTAAPAFYAEIDSGGRLGGGLWAMPWWAAAGTHRLQAKRLPIVINWLL